MNLDLLRDRIIQSSQWVIDKSKGNNKLTVTCGVRTVDWENKMFSPVFCALRHSSCQGINFIPPPGDQIIPQIAATLNISIEQATQIIDTCYYNSDVKTVYSFNLEVEEECNHHTINHKVIHKSCKKVSLTEDPEILHLARELNLFYPSLRNNKYVSDLTNSYIVDFKQVPSESEYQYLYPNRFSFGDIS